jgi:outer membrane lipoprotein-sorting protein
MIFRILTLASALLLMAGCAANGGNEAATVAQADATAVSEAQAETQQAAEEDQLVCKTVVKTGTRLRERICAPKEAWDDSAEYGRKATEEMQRRPDYLEAQ